MDRVIFSLALILSNSLCFKDAKEDYVYFVKVLEWSTTYTAKYFNTKVFSLVTKWINWCYISWFEINKYW